ncbi:TetR/AcrR family transcriptional regulator [Streptomyces pinistramenti]|uniref:TetR/AcrR family transcriptional regulator n=1 Tax=Streptomyces pinistramenti TaxID=2884812 RepID=UPI001D07AD4F|nr:TetR family transcriptional regulator [Streptomyces pinistramenti]MCB5911510.1 TetR family transcriptional regulator [Streptomyces pinistramenti]
MVSARTSAATPAGTPAIGLRERKKIQTRQAIRRAAYRLFDEQGYDATPVDQIADAAEVSPSTVFRYFPTKEDIVLRDAYDSVLEAAIRGRPAGEPVAETLRQAAVTALRALVAGDHGELVQRARLIRYVPAVRGRTAENLARDTELISALLAERAGRPAGDLEVRVISAAILAALQETLLRWAEEIGAPGAVGSRAVDSGPTELEAMIHRTMDLLTRGLTLSSD